MSIDSMRAGRSTARVALMNYATIRGKNPDRLICVFEGHEDLPYYETVFNRVLGRAGFASLIAKGKDQVLELRELLKRQHSQDRKVRFFIDRDYDYLKGYSEGEDIYVTDGYSIENHLVSKDILISLMDSEFKCCAEADYAAMDRIAELFDKFLSTFFEIMRPVNKAIYYARTHGVELKNIEDRVSEYFILNLEGMQPTENDYFSLIGWPDQAAREISAVDSEFSQLDPQAEWRGKFLYGLFIKILHLIKVDRTSDQPTLFSRKAGVRFDPNGEVVRSFASIASIPDSLCEFVQECPL